VVVPVVAVAVVAVTNAGAEHAVAAAHFEGHRMGWVSVLVAAEPHLSRAGHVSAGKCSVVVVDAADETHELSSSSTGSSPCKSAE